MQRFLWVALAAAMTAATAASPAGAKPGGIHEEPFPCVQCHVRDPGADAALDEAPLVLPVETLCASCHEYSEEYALPGG